MIPVIRRNVRNLWNDPFEAMHKELDRFLGYGREANGGEGGGWSGVGNYPVDIREDADHVYIEAEMPGFKKDEVAVTLEGGVITIAGERRVEQKDDTRHLSERRFTRVQRSFSLPTTVDESKVDAKLIDGVLHVSLNKREEVKPRKIEVK